MKSRVHPTYKTKYRVKHWASYDRALVRRGDITIWLSPAAIAAWEPDRAGTRGAQRKYSDLAIESALTLRLLFHLPIRQAEGVLMALFVLMGLDLRVPDHTTLSRRGRHLDLSRRRVPKRAGLHLIIDSSGLSIVGEGEWATAKHGRRGRRGWKKLRLGVDPTGVIVAHALTEALVRRCGQAYALQTVEPVTSRCGTRRVCQARSSGSERDTRARPHAVAPMNCVPEDSRRRSTCTGRTHSPRARADGHQTPSSTVAVRAPSPS